MDKLKQLFFEGSLKTGLPIKLGTSLANRLSKELRLSTGTHISLFNGRDGLFKVKITHEGCKKAKVLEQIKPFVEPNNVTLFIALAKKDVMDNILHIATELNINSVQPITTEYCYVDTLQTDGFATIITQATEQCERLDILEINPLAQLKQAIEDYSGTIFWCDEVKGGKWGEHTSQKGDAILIGPKDGFSPEERTFLQQQPNIKPVGLGKNMLRADTAIAVACGLFFDTFK